MNIVMKSTQRIVNTVPVILILIVISLIGYRFYDPEFDVFSSLSGVAAIAVAYLTVAYVITTSQQLNVMAEQLIEIKKSRELVDQPQLNIMTQQLVEMKKSRELVDQPLPTVKVKKMIIEKPRFFYTPPLDEYSWQSLINIEITIQNISNYPAVNVCIYPTLFIDEGSDLFSLSEYGEFFEILGQDTIDKKFIITEDVKGRVIKALANNYHPKLLVKILYKNILGSSFLSEHYFFLRPGNFKKLGIETYKTRKNLLSQWYENIKSFESNFRNELIAIKNLTPNKSEEWRSQFDNIKERFHQSLNGDEVFMIETTSDSSRYKISVIDSQVYADEVETKRSRFKS